MTTQARPPHGDPGPDAAAPSGPLVPLPERDEVLEQLADAQVAYEELRVAEEEMRAQQEKITELLLQYDAERRWRGQMQALVPVGLGVTDGNGSLIDGNPALAAYLGTALQRLRGKPLSVFLGRDDVRAFRSAVSSLASGTDTVQRLSATVQARHRPPEPAQLFGFTEIPHPEPSAARIQWILMPQSSSDAGPPLVREQGHPAQEPDAGGSRREQSMDTSEVIGLATSLAQLSALPGGEPNRQRLLSRMATLVRGAVPGADWVSITLGSPRDPQRLGSDSAEAQIFDGLQVQAAEGPCWTAYSTGAIVTTGDVTTDARWPSLGAVAIGGPVCSALAVPIREEGSTAGVVNVYSGERDAFGPAGHRIAELVSAAVVGVLQSVAERESMQALAANLERALTSRAVIDQAKGMIMARLDVDADEAFARLVKVSSRLNVKVRDLAALIVEGHVDAVMRAVD